MINQYGCYYAFQHCNIITIFRNKKAPTKMTYSDISRLLFCAWNRNFTAGKVNKRYWLPLKVFEQHHLLVREIRE